jgi:hypothetical protein
MDNNSADKCPLCDSDNLCAIALNALPESERGVRCICPTCGKSERSEN